MANLSKQRPKGPLGFYWEEAYKICGIRAEEITKTTMRGQACPEK
jgi:hypothetical protein